MEIKQSKLALMASVTVAMLTLGACSTSIPGEQTSIMATSDTSTTFVDTFTTTARVTAIDAATRKVTLALENGKRVTAKCGPEVANFKQIQINDVIKVTVTEEMAAYLDKGKRMGTSGSSSGARAPIGAKPGAVMAASVQETVKIKAIDRNTRMVTFVEQDGSSHKVKVRGHIDLSKAKVGDSVTISLTQATAISVEKP